MPNDGRSSSSGWALLLGMVFSAIALLPRKQVSDQQEFRLPTLMPEHKHSSHWWESWAALAQIAIALGTIGVLYLNYKQTSLLTHQIVGSDGARAFINFSLEPDDPSSIQISIGNDGKSASPHIEAHYTAQRESGWPTGENIGGPVPVEPEPVEQLRNKDIDGTVNRLIKIPGLQHDNILQRKETLVLNGYFTFDDGFNNKRTVRDCYRLMAGRTGDSEYKRAGFYQCDRVELFKNEWLRLDKDADQQKKKP